MYLLKKQKQKKKTTKPKNKIKNNKTKKQNKKMYEKTERFLLAYTVDSFSLKNGLIFLSSN